MYKTNRAIQELRQMPQAIRTDAQTWSRVVANEFDQLQVYAELCSEIFENENLFYDASATREKRLRRPFKRLEKHIKVMKQILEVLRLNQRRAERMWRRIQLWNADTDVQQHCISWELTNSKLKDFLQFLAERYDFEWEVKEMVVLELDRVNNDYDIYILLEAWRDNRHAGGDEFDGKLKEFYKFMGLRRCNSYVNIL